MGKRTLDWVGSRPPWWSLLLATVLSVSVGYLLEVALLEGAEALLRDGNLALFIVGIIAMAILAALWASRAAAGVRRGCFVHAVTGPPSHLARATTEHALLVSWAKDAWPFSPVLPLRPELGVDDTTATGNLASTVMRQTGVATKLVPAIKSVTILPAGPPHRMVPLGAQLAHLDGVRIRLLADNTNDDDTPFLEFELPPPTDPMKAGSPRGEPVVLFLKGRQDSVAGGSNDNVEKITIQDLPVEHRADDGLIKRNAASYTAFLDLVQTRLLEWAPSEVTIRSSTAASLTFGAGLIAGRLGIAVKSQPLDHDHYGPSIETPRPTAVEVGRTAMGKGAAARWWSTLVGTSALLGITVPLFSASVALTLEWALARSQGDDPLPLKRLGAILIASVFVAGLSYSLRRVTIESPRVLLTVGASPSSTRGKRVIEIPESPVPCEQSQLISDTYCDAVSVVPAATQYVLALNSLERHQAREVVCHSKYGLDKTLRGRRPVSLVWNDQESKAGPRVPADAQWPQ